MMKTCFRTLAISVTLCASPLPAQFLYVADGTSPQVTPKVMAFRIGSTGTLSSIGDVADLESDPDTITVGPGGRFVYVTSVDNKVLEFSANPSGSLNVAGSAATGTSPIQVAVEPGGRFAYLTNYRSNYVAAYSIASSGALTSIDNGSPVVTSSPGGVAVDSTGRFVYVVNYGSPGSVSAFSIASNGILVPIGSPVPAGSGSSEVAVDPNGDFVYVTNFFGHNLSAYRIASNGGLTLIASTPDTGDTPTCLAVDPSGRYVYVSNYGNTVSAFAIGSGGALTLIGSPVAAGNFPNSVVVDPSGKFVYVGNTNDGTISAYSIVAGGALTSIDNGSPASAYGHPLFMAATWGTADNLTNLTLKNFADVSLFSLNAMAAQESNYIALTDDLMSESGSAFLWRPFLLKPTSSFSSSFAFQIGGVNDSGDMGSDGMAFLIQHDPGGPNHPAGPLAIGNTGEGLGFGTNATAGNPLLPISPSIAIEFDTHQNAFDPDGNHVALIVDGDVQHHQAVYSIPCPPPLGSSLGCLNSGAPVYAWIDYSGPAKLLQVFLATQPLKPATPIISTTVPPLDDLPGHLGGGIAYLGFTAATGLGFNYHHLLNWTLTVPGVAPGDLNGDGVIDCTDLGIVKAAFGKRAGQPGFNPYADTNSDGIIDIRDLSFVAQKIAVGTRCN